MHRSLLYLILYLSITGCAQKIGIEGGPKDIESPFITSSSPERAQTNFTGTELNFEFNEFIEASTLPSKLIISPSLSEKPDVKVGSKKVNITLKESLKENTTYIINFSDNVKDITERNIIDPMPFVFSTGSYIDSAKLKGRVINAQTLEPAVNVWILAYEQSLASQDSLPWLTKPTYLIPTNESGNFQLDYLSPGNYLLYALQEEDQNYTYNEKVELIAFDTLLQNTLDTLQNITLKSIKGN